MVCCPSRAKTQDPAARLDRLLKLANKASLVMVYISTNDCFTGHLMDYRLLQATWKAPEGEECPSDLLKYPFCPAMDNRRFWK